MLDSVVAANAINKDIESWRGITEYRHFFDLTRDPVSSLIRDSAASYSKCGIRK